jgi:hypothetical protein
MRARNPLQCIVTREPGCSVPLSIRPLQRFTETDYLYQPFHKTRCDSGGRRWPDSFVGLSTYRDWKIYPNLVMPCTLRVLRFLPLPARFAFRQGRSFFAWPCLAELSRISKRICGSTHSSESFICSGTHVSLRYLSSLHIPRRPRGNIDSRSKAAGGILEIFLMNGCYARCGY